MRFNKVFMLLAAAMMATMLSGVANAGIIYNLTGVTPNGSNFDWKYNAQLSADQQLATSATDFAVVYDFLNVLGASVSNVASGLTIATSDVILENLTSTQPTLQNVPDSASFQNVRVVIHGTLIPTALTVIYTLDILTPDGNRGNFVYQSGQAEKYVLGDPTNGTASGNTVQIEGPAANVSSTPEPATMALLGSALIGLGLIGRKRFVRR